MTLEQQQIRSARSMDAADNLIRALVPYRTRVRLYDRYGNFGPFISMSGTVPCSYYTAGASGCVEAHAKQGGTAWGGASEGTLTGFCHTRGSLPSEYHESLLSADYVVRSYDTPIGWHVNTCDWSNPRDVERWVNDDEHPGLWIIPDVSYSPTTYQHQGHLRGALTGTWRNNHPPLPTEELNIEGAPMRVRSGGRS